MSPRGRSDTQTPSLSTPNANRSEVHGPPDRAILRCRASRGPLAPASRRRAVIVCFVYVYLGTVLGGRSAVRAQADVCVSQVPGGAVERAARRSAAALRGGGWRRGARGVIPGAAGGRRLAPAGAGRVGRAGHAAGGLPPAVPPPHPAARPQLHAAAARTLAGPAE